jgi:hypothetical protein
MPSIKGYTAIFRGGKLVPGGTIITVSDEELPDFLDRGFEVVYEDVEIPVVKDELVDEVVDSLTHPIPDGDPLAGIDMIQSLDTEDEPKMRGRRKKSEG